MSNPMVRTIGSVLDLDGLTVRVGVDYDSVTIKIGTVEFSPKARLEGAAVGEFAALYERAVAEAARQASVLGSGDGA